MVGEFWTTWLFTQSAVEISSKCLDSFIYELIKGKWISNTLGNVFMIGKACLATYLLYRNLAYHWQQSGRFLANITHLSWQQISTVSAKTSVHSALMYFPITGLIKQLENLAENYLPRSVLEAKADFSYGSYLNTANIPQIEF